MRFILLLNLIVALTTLDAKAFNNNSGIGLTVSADGSGDVKTVQDAIDKIPANNKKRFVIYIKQGFYKQQINIPNNKPFVTFRGDNAEKTILTFDLNNAKSGSTSASYSVYIGGHDFRAENITFENSFGKGSQAVAALVEADRATFKNCRFIGWQDTLYAKNGRQFYQNCYIEGHVDFIFGQASAVFENCVIHSKGDGYIAAPMRFAANEASGFVFLKSKLTGANTEKGVFLGRPWRDYGRTVYIETEMGAHIKPEGWNNWLPEREKTAYFAEYKSTGAGAKPESRVKWIHQLSEAESKQFLPETFLKGADGWNPKSDILLNSEVKKLSFQPVEWKDVLKQSKTWYSVDEASRIADQVVIYQHDNGGWGKNVDMAAMLTQAEREKLLKEKTDTTETTIDNRSTFTQVNYLAKVITASLAKTTPP
ncbi:MAG: hypothetical protein H7Z37_04275, partial [Pyrinomonadaceae bacterium]|nr:hypothetical protein [Pyrinomonadaceae bacterium]